MTEALRDSKITIRVAPDLAEPSPTTSDRSHKNRIHRTDIVLAEEEFRRTVTAGSNGRTAVPNA